MKVMFRFSPRGDIQHASIIEKQIELLGHSLTSKFANQINVNNFYTTNDEIWEKRYHNCLREIIQADVCIVEASIPSTAIGQIVTMAVNNNKPTIILCYQNCTQFFFRGLARVNSRVQLLDYTEKDIQMVLKYAFDEVRESINTRFTLLLPPDIISFLKNKRKKQGINSSDFIRNLIKKEIRPT